MHMKWSKDERSHLRLPFLLPQIPLSSQSPSFFSQSHILWLWLIIELRSMGRLNTILIINWIFIKNRRFFIRGCSSFKIFSCNEIGPSLNHPYARYISLQLLHFFDFVVTFSYRKFLNLSEWLAALILFFSACFGYLNMPYFHHFSCSLHFHHSFSSFGLHLLLVFLISLCFIM